MLFRFVFLATKPPIIAALQMETVLLMRHKAIKRKLPQSSIWCRKNEFLSAFLLPLVLHTQMFAVANCRHTACLR